MENKKSGHIGYKIGIITTANLNHATPAGYYAHQPSRKNYYSISKELIKSEFDFFAGGDFISPKGKKGKSTHIHTLAKKAGYQIIKKQTKMSNLTVKDKKVILIGETLEEKKALSYSIDASKDEWKLKDYVNKGIEVLQNETGFFMMVEAGKIDWACHANDAGSAISEVLALNDAVNEALKFYKKYPEDTLILVTGDHETGGLSIGYTGTEYDTYLSNFKNQKISYAKFVSDYVTKYKEKNTSFEKVRIDIKKNFGLLTKTDKKASKESTLIMTEDEYKQLKRAYKKTMSLNSKARSQEEKILYGSYDPLTVTILHILNRKSGINFSSYFHTGLPVAVYAKGTGQTLFSGYYDSTEVYHNLVNLLKVK